MSNALTFPRKKKPKEVVFNIIKENIRKQIHRYCKVDFEFKKLLIEFSGKLPMEGKLNIKYLCLSFLQKELIKGSIIDVWQDRLIQKQPPEVFFEKSLLKHFAIFIDKLPCWSIFLIKLQVFREL